MRLSKSTTRAMFGLDPPPSAAEVIESWASYHANRLRYTWLFVFGPAEPYPDELIRRVFGAYVTGHPHAPASQRPAANHEAAHFIAAERLGLKAGKAEIHGSPGGHGGWGGLAGSLDWHNYAHPEDWDAAALRCAAVSTLAGPIGEELLAGGDALSSIGELCVAEGLALRCGVDEDREPWVVIREVVFEATALVEQCRAEIGCAADVLARRKRITCWLRPVKKILARVPRGPIDIGGLSAAGRVLCDKIMGAFEELESLATLVEVQPWEA